MDEELAKIMGNAELDDAGKQEAIKAFLNTNYVPAKIHREEVKNLKGKVQEKETEFNNFKQSKMTEDEKKAEQERIKEESYQKTNLLLSKMVAETTFAKAGFKEDEYSDLLDSVIQSDYEKTQEFATKICNTMLKQKEAMESKLKQDIINGTPKPPEGGDGENKTSNLDLYKKKFEEACKEHNVSNMAYYTRLIQEEEFKNKKN